MATRHNPTPRLGFWSAINAVATAENIHQPLSIRGQRRRHTVRGLGSQEARSRMKIRVEYLLWLVLAIIAFLMITVNFMLLEHHQEHGQGNDYEENDMDMNGQPVSIGDGNRRFPPEYKDPLISVLKAGGIDDTPEVRRLLPSWQQILDRFGEKPRIVGLDTCVAYRKSVPASERMIAPAGTFSSGTNWLHQAIIENCEILRGGQRAKHREDVQWQVNWGKHSPPWYRLENRREKKYDNKFYLPVVIVRDPYTWMQSMCKARYSAHWFHVVPDHCPNFIPNHVEREWFMKSKSFISRHYNKDPWKVDNVWNKANYTLDSKVIPLQVRYKNGYVFHDSLVHMWNDWYQEYFDSDFPRLMIRLEDLVYRPVELLEQVCDCAGGEFASVGNLKLKGVPAKTKDNVHVKEQTDLVGSMISHIHTNRTQGMTQEDAEFAENYLKGSKMMTVFGYATSPH